MNLFTKLTFSVSNLFRSSTPMIRALSRINSIPANGIPVVIDCSSKIKMIWINATRFIAFMTNEFIIRYISYMNFIRHSVCSQILFFRWFATDFSVAIFVGTSQPLPAFGTNRRVSLIKETLFERNSRSAHNSYYKQYGSYEQW